MTDTNNCNPCERKYYKWIYNLDDSFNGFWECTKCGKKHEHEWKYVGKQVIKNPAYGSEEM